MKTIIVNCPHGADYYRLRPRNWLFTPVRDILHKIGWSKKPYLYDITTAVGGRITRDVVASDTFATWIVNGFEVHNGYRGMIWEIEKKER